MKKALEWPARPGPCVHHVCVLNRLPLLESCSFWRTDLTSEVEWTLAVHMTELALTCSRLLDSHSLTRLGRQL